MPGLISVQSKLRYKNDDLIFDMLRAYNILKPTFQKINEEQTRDYNMTVAELQWDPTVRKAVKDEGRPVNSYNLLRGVVRYLSGLHEGSRNNIIVKPKTVGDYEISKEFTMLLRHLMGKNDWGYKQTRGFIDAIIAKYAFYYVGYDYESDPEGMPTIENIDPRKVMFEFNYADVLLKKSEYVLYKDQLSVEQIINKYAADNIELQEVLIDSAQPYFSESLNRRGTISRKLKLLFEAAKEVMIEGDWDTNNEHTRTDYLDWYNPANGKFDLLEFHEKRTDRRMYMFNENENVQMDITDAVRDKSGLRFEPQLIDRFKRERKLRGEPQVELVNYRHITTAVPALEVITYDKPYPFYSETPLIVPQFAYDYHADLALSQSVIDDLIDPQSDFNKARSTKLEMLQRFVSRGNIIEDGAIDGFESDWQSNEIGLYKRVNPGYFNKVRPEEMPRIEPELIRETQEMPVLIQHLGGYTNAAQGRSDYAGEPARANLQKRQQTEKSYSYLFGRADIAVKAIGGLLVNYVQTFMSEQRVFRITHDSEDMTIGFNKRVPMVENGQVIFRVINDLTVGKYDIEIDPTPYGSTARELEYLKLMELVKLIIEIDVEKAREALPVIIKASDSSYRTELLQLFKSKEGEDGANKAQQQMMMMEMLEKRAGIEGKQIENKGKMIENKGNEIENMLKMVELGEKEKKRKLLAILNNMFTGGAA